MTANITPEKEAEFLLKSIEESPEHSRNVLMALLVSSAYILLSAFSKQTVDKVTLPLVNVTVTTSEFFVVAPLVILGEYLYLHIYIRDLREKLTAFKNADLSLPHPELRDMLPFPWIATFAFSKDRSSKYTRIATVFLVWLFGPFALFALWLRFVNQEQITSLIPCSAIIFAVYGNSESVFGRRATKICCPIAGLMLIFISLISVPAIRDPISLDPVWELWRKGTESRILSNVFASVASGITVLIASLIASTLNKPLRRWFKRIR
jgi:hypothetical protein